MFQRRTRATVGFPGLVLVAVGFVGLAQASPPPPHPEVRDLHMVAHQDDDLLFMNPNIQNSIAAGHTVKTVYVTAGDSCSPNPSYYLNREAGVQAAYARMAGVANQWTVLPNKPTREVTLDQRPGVSLVFFRLGSAQNEQSQPCAEHNNETLKKLWLGDSPTISPVDDATKDYTKQDLINALTTLITEFQPNNINTLDSSNGSQTSECGPERAEPANPSECVIDYSIVRPTLFPYIYDHSEHYYSTLFALASRASYSQPHTFRRYRGYNIANESENIFAGSPPGARPMVDQDLDFTLKQNVFEVYAEHDDFISDDPPFGPFYDGWLARQYLVKAASPSTGAPGRK